MIWLHQTSLDRPRSRSRVEDHSLLRSGENRFQRRHVPHGLAEQ